MNYQLLYGILLVLAASVITVAAFRRLNLPPVLAYLLVGVAVGPSGFAWVNSTGEIQILAEIGVVFLLFTIGLEFSLPKLLAMRDTVIGLGGAQVLVTSVIAGLVAWFAGATPSASLVIGGVIAMSSTAIVIKQLTEQAELHTRHGRLSVGVLLFQDLAVIPLLIVIPLLAAGTEGPVALPLTIALLKGILAFVVLTAIGHFALRPVFHEVATARSAELFTLTVLLVALSAGAVTHMLGLSMALGGFIAGIMLGETKFRHQIEADIRPFRDMLLGLFFITVGMLVDVQKLPAILPLVLLATVVVVVGKAALVTLLARRFGEELHASLRAGLNLGQCGEFGFALLTLAIGLGIMESLAGQVVLGTVLLTMVIAPLLIRHGDAIVRRLGTRQQVSAKTAQVRAIAKTALDLDKHVIICGYGRVGQNIARLLEQEDISYIALDLDPVRVQDAQGAGDTVRYGDSTRIEILAAAGLRRARALVISYNDTISTHKILQHTREMRPDMPVLVRTQDDMHLEAFQKAGATEVVPETLEASLMLASHLLLLLDIPVTRVLRRVQAIRSDRYRLLRGLFHGSTKGPKDDEHAMQERLHSVALPEGAFGVGRTLEELELENAGVIVTAVRRGGIRGPQPGPETRLFPGDVLVLYGNPEALETAEAQLLKG